MPEALVKMQLVVETFNQILVGHMYIFEPVYMVLALQQTGSLSRCTPPFIVWQLE